MNIFKEEILSDIKIYAKEPNQRICAQLLITNNTNHITTVVKYREVLQIEALGFLWRRDLPRNHGQIEGKWSWAEK